MFYKHKPLPLQNPLVGVCSHMIIRMLEFELLAQQADGAGQWGTQNHVCAHVSWVVGVHLFFRQLRVCPRHYVSVSSLVISHVSVSSSVTCPLDARRDGTRRLT